MDSYNFSKLSCRKLKTLWMSMLALAMVMFGLQLPGYAQSTTGSLRGQILDSSQAAVPLAEVTVTNQQTGVVTSVTTTSAGTYSIPSIIPGLYSVAVQAQGFKSIKVAIVCSVRFNIFGRGKASTKVTGNGFKSIHNV